VIEEEFTVSLGAFARRRPFRHFLIEFVNAQTLRIRHPEGVAPFAGVWLFHGREGERVVFASSSVCRILDAPQEASTKEQIQPF
jgi:hypothetical protein